MVVNASNKNAFAGANLGVPFSPIEAVTSMDPKDYVWTNPLLGCQMPQLGLGPGHPMGALHAMPGLMDGPALPQASLFPGLGAFPWCGVQSLPTQPSFPPVAPQMPVLHQGQELLQGAGSQAAPATLPPQTKQKAVEEPAVPLPPENTSNMVNVSDLLKSCMEDDDLKQLLEDPLDVAFEGLASDSSNASCLTGETSSPDPKHEALEDDFLSFTDLNFTCIDADECVPNACNMASTAGPVKQKKTVPKSRVHWGVKKKRSTRRSKTDYKELNAADPMNGNMGDVALIELGGMLVDMDARALPGGTACLFPNTNGGQDLLQPERSCMPLLMG